MPFHSMSEWINYDYSKLAGFFKWRKDKALPTRPALRAVRDVIGQIGSIKPTRGRRKTAPNTVANTPLNERVYDALRRLTRLQRKNQVSAIFPVQSTPIRRDKSLIYKGAPQYSVRRRKYLIANKSKTNTSNGLKSSSNAPSKKTGGHTPIYASSLR